MRDYVLFNEFLLYDASVKSTQCECGNARSSSCPRHFWSDSWRDSLFSRPVLEKKVLLPEQVFLFAEIVDCFYLHVWLIELNAVIESTCMNLFACLVVTLIILE